VSALAHYFERAGIPAVAVSLIRQHTERMKSPRALAVPFELGRPFGAPDEPALQKRVLLAALRLLERTDGPVLEDFPERSPRIGSEEGWSCPIDLSSPKAAGEAESLEAEIALLEPWYREAGRGGRRLDGLTKQPPAALARFLLAFRDDPATPGPLAGVPAVRAVKLAADDLKHFYYQAALAQPGAVTDVRIASWFFGETRMGNLFLQIREKYLASDNEALARLAQLQLVPGHQQHRKPGARK
jgi:hypothetical protein